jgi:hypothetical protein
VGQALFTGNDQFDRDELHTEPLLDREYFLNLLAYSPFWLPAPAEPLPKAFVRTTEGSITSEEFYIWREVGFRGQVGERGLWGYQLRQQEDLDEAYFYQYFEAEAPIYGPLKFRIFGQPTAKKQHSDIGSGLWWEGGDAEGGVEATLVDFSFNEKNLDNQRDRRKLYNVRAKVQTRPRAPWKGEIAWEWDSPVEREFADDAEVFGFKRNGITAAAGWARWLLRTGWRREQRYLDPLVPAERLQDFRRTVVYSDFSWLLKEGREPWRLGLQVQRRQSQFVEAGPSAASQDRLRWETNPYLTSDWRIRPKAVLESGLYMALGEERVQPFGQAPTRENYFQTILKTALRLDFNPQVSLVINPTWDIDQLFTARAFEGGNVQLRLLLP